MNTLDGPIWSRCSIALTCPVRSHFQRTLNRKRRAKARINVAAHQKEKNKKMRKGKTEGQEKREDRRPILKLHAALLRPFRGQHGKKWFAQGECLR